MTFSSVESIISGARIFLDRDFEKALHILHLVAIGIGQTDVDDLGAVFDLRARDLGGVVEFLRRQMSVLNFLLPMTLVRSPTITGRISSVISR